MNNAKEYFGEDFVEKVYKIFEKAKNEEKLVFMHGTHTLDQAKSIVSDGLACEYPELYYTADLMNTTDTLLFEKLKSWPHWDLKYLLTLLIPRKSGKGGIPIWNENESGLFLLSPLLIYGIIDVNKKSILLNPKYSETKGIITGTVEDRSFETGTGRCIEISLSSIEEEMYEEASRPNQIDEK